MSFYHQEDCDNWKWSKNSKLEPSKPISETDLSGSTYTIEPDKIKLESVTSEDIIFKIVVFDDHSISVFTDDPRGKGYGLRGNYQYAVLLEMAEDIKTHLRLNPKFELVREESNGQQN